jgi:hypothetical protein
MPKLATKPVVAVTFAPTLYDQILKRANDEQRSTSSLVRYAVSEYLREHEARANGNEGA